MRRFSLALFCVFGTILLVPPALGASANGAAGFPPGTFFTVEPENVLNHYHLAAPGQRLGSVNITGMDPQENMLGIDFRPATGQLYGLGSYDRLYIIDTVTGRATPVGSSFTPFLDDAAFGFDFNPMTDQIRVVSSTGQNLRLNPDTGQVAAVDAAINPASEIEASAYTNNLAGATSTTLYGINPATDQLVIQSPPNNGTVTPVGSLGVNAGVNSGFDIAPGSNTAYAAIFQGELPSLLYTINLATGAATLVGAIGGGDGGAVRGLAIVAGPETVYGVSTSNKLVSFRSNTPGSILSSFPITGLQVSENILGIDFRPATGELYGLGSTSRIYRISIVSGAATQVGTGTLTTPLNGTNFGFDFNPTVDRIRVVSDLEQSIAINPDTAAVTVNANLNPAGNVVAAAYANNFAGATSTTLYDMDSVSDLLLTQIPATGVLTPVGPLGVDASGLTGLDIATSGLAFASITLQGAGSTNFYTVNLATGATTLVGTIGGGELIRDTAARVYTEVVYALTQVAGPASNLIRFNAATPGIIISTVAITGLQAGETLLGIDFRPTSGQLFALGSTSRLYTINPVTGAATQVGPVLTTALNGTNFGVDFNPTVDRIRIVSNAEQSIAVNPNNAAVTVNGALNPGDPNIVGAAYTNNFAGAMATTLYDVDSAASQLFTQNTATGLLTLVGSLGISVSNGSLGFDIARGTGHAFLSAYTGGVSPGFYKVNLSAGAATLIGNVNTTELLIDFSVLFEREDDIFSDGFE